MNYSEVLLDGTDKTSASHTYIKRLFFGSYSTTLLVPNLRSLYLYTVACMRAKFSVFPCMLLTPSVLAEIP